VPERLIGRDDVADELLEMLELAEPARDLDRSA